MKLKYMQMLTISICCGLLTAHSAFGQNHCPASKARMTQHISAQATQEESKVVDIVDTAVAAGKFKTLAAALGAAELVDALKGEGPFTVFAPTDEAFAKLPEGTVENLIKPKNKETLQGILKYHVASGQLKAKDVVRLRLLETLLGKDVLIEVDGDNVSINGSKVVMTDIECSNGVIHVIDTVILPK